MQKVFFLLLLSLVFTPFSCVFAQSSNAGIVQGLWYSKEKVFAGEEVRIYVAIRNNTGGDLTGIVEFYDGEKKLERQNVQALSGRIIESWTDWSPTYGSHNLKAILTRTELSQVGSSTKEIVASSALAEDTLFVDYDTDKDGIGNTEDQNDDNDSFTDAEEKQNGTDPLIQNKTEVKTETNDKNEEDKNLVETDNEYDKRGTSQASSEGLEQYLAPSRAETVLSSVTHYVDTAKQKVDNYRVARRDADETLIDAEKQKGTNGGVTGGQANEDGFGEVTRKDADKTRINVGGFLDKTVALTASLFNTIYTFILWLVSFVLGHPILVQLGLLPGILFIIIRLAAKFGNRRNRG